MAPPASLFALLEDQQNKKWESETGALHEAVELPKESLLDWLYKSHYTASLYEPDCTDWLYEPYYTDWLPKVYEFHYIGLYEDENPSKAPEEDDGNFSHRRERLISGVYFADASGKSEAVKLKMEHCAKLSLGHKWNVAVKVCAQDSKINQKKKLWVDIKELYPDAIVEMSKNSIEVTLNSPKENHQFAVFGTPDVIDKKRMQLGLFGEKPVTGKDWKIIPILFDDTVMAYQNVCRAEKARGRQLLTTLAGLFVSNSDQDIEINFRDVELSWKVKGGKTKIIRSKDAWNSPEDCTDFPRCFIEISHEDIKKRSFMFALIVSHEHDYAGAEVIAYYEDPVEVHTEKGQKP